MPAESVPCRRAEDERSKRADMTGQRGPRQAVARPARTIATAPATAAARQAAPAMITRPGPAMTISCTAPPEDAPLVVEPPSGPASAVARAAARTAEVCRLAVLGAGTASRTPTARLTTDLAAVIATRSVLRRAVGVLLAVLGAGTAVAVLASLHTSAILAAARASALSGPLGGSTTGGTPSGGAVHEIVIAGPGRVIMAGAPWRAAAVAGAVAIVLAGLATAWRGSRWPVMSARFERSAAARPRGSDSASMWESLSRDVDPTVDDGTRS